MSKWGGQGGAGRWGEGKQWHAQWRHAARTGIYTAYVCMRARTAQAKAALCGACVEHPSPRYIYAWPHGVPRTPCAGPVQAPCRQACRCCRRPRMPTTHAWAAAAAGMGACGRRVCMVRGGCRAAEWHPQGPAEHSPPSAPARHAARTRAGAGSGGSVAGAYVHGTRGSVVGDIVSVGITAARGDVCKRRGCVGASAGCRAAGAY